MREATDLLNRQVEDYLRDVQHGYEPLQEYYEARTPVDIHSLREFFNEGEFVTACRHIGVTVIRRYDSFRNELILHRRYRVAYMNRRRVAIFDGDTMPLYVAPNDPVEYLDVRTEWVEELEPLPLHSILRDRGPNARATPEDYRMEVMRGVDRRTAEIEAEYNRAARDAMVIPPRYMQDNLPHLRPGGVNWFDEEPKEYGGHFKQTANGEYIFIRCKETVEEYIPLTWNQVFEDNNWNEGE